MPSAWPRRSLRHAWVGRIASTPSGGGHASRGPRPRDIIAQTRTPAASGADGTAAFSCNHDRGRGRAVTTTCSRGATGGLLMDWAKHGVKIVHSDELDLNTPQTSGMTRAAAITHARAGASKLCAGTMAVHPDAQTGPHHHGALETLLYEIMARVRMR